MRIFIAATWRSIDHKHIIAPQQFDVIGAQNRWCHKNAIIYVIGMPSFPYTSVRHMPKIALEETEPLCQKRLFTYLWNHHNLLWSEEFPHGQAHWPPLYTRNSNKYERYALNLLFVLIGLAGTRCWLIECDKYMKLGMLYANNSLINCFIQRPLSVHQILHTHIYLYAHKLFKYFINIINRTFAHSKVTVWNVLYETGVWLNYSNTHCRKNR